MLTKAEKRKLYEQAWDLIDEVSTVLEPISAEEDIRDLRSLVAVMKRKVEAKTSALHEFDPN